VAAPVQAALHRVLRPGPAKDALSGVPLSHPLHPALIVLPLGSWLSASALDLLGGPAAAPAARRLVGVGLLTAVPTAVAGASDWSDTSGAERRVGVAHALANSVALGLMGASWLARRRGRRGLGVGLALAANGVGGFSASLGGHLSYGQGVGVATTAFLRGPRDWTEVARLDDLPDGAVTGVDAGGARLALLRRGDRVDALLARCTHRGGPLDEGEVVDGCVTCPWHGSRFRADDGTVVRGPASVPQPVLDVRIAAGAVEVRHRTGRSLQADVVRASDD
jgi:nitrite reductase/ring-hydroxylating ferredoxin subunit/uncharacterized membrane protein